MGGGGELILTSWKDQNKRHKTLPKDAFPKLLWEEVGLYESSSLISGFKAAGINLLDQNYVLKRLPDFVSDKNTPKQIANEVVLVILRRNRCLEKTGATKRKRMFNKESR